MRLTKKVNKEYQLKKNKTDEDVIKRLGKIEDLLDKYNIKTLKELKLVLAGNKYVNIITADLFQNYVEKARQENEFNVNSTINNAITDTNIFKKDLYRQPCKSNGTGFIKSKIED